MRDWRRARSLALAVTVIALGALAAPHEADAHPRGRGRGVYIGGFYGFNPWFGFGPYGGWGLYPPAFYQPVGGVDMNVAMMAGFGAVELNAKPNRADVWVDGRYVGEARDLDGYPSYLWLAEGPHRVAVHKGGFLVFDEEIDVRRRMKTEIKLKLQPGDSPPPGAKPVEKEREKKQKNDKKEE